jgi:hypothetical protein
MASMPIAPMLHSALAGGLLLAAINALPARALLVSVGGANYNVGFIEGCFTSNDLAVSVFYPGCGTGYSTPDLYANGTGPLTTQPWWGDESLASLFAKAYRDAALVITGGASNRCDYHPNLGGAGCDDSPYFAFASSSGPRYYDGWGYYFYTDPNKDYLRQSGYFAVLESTPSQVPAPLPLAGTALAFGYRRRLRRLIDQIRHRR